MRGKILFSLFIFTLLAMFAAIKYRRTLDVQEIAEKRSRSAPHGPVNSLGAAAPAKNTASEATSQVARVAGSAGPDFRNWIRDEAKSVDDLNVNGEQKQAQMRAMVKEITPAQARQLREVVMAPQSAAREKILSVYLLVEGGGRTRAELSAAITAPLKQKGGEVHSEDEMNNVREKSLRIMMIDGLFAQAQTEPAARETLAKTIDDSADPYIKAYAQEKYDQLSKQ